MTLITRSFVTAFATASISFGLAACTQTQSLPSPVPEAQIPAAEVQLDDTDASGPALWKVADDDTTIYLFGTVHALPTDVEWMTDGISAALQSSDVIVTEIRMDEGSDAAMQQVIMTKGLLPAGTTLRSLLTQEQTEAYEAAMGQISVPPAAFDQFEPWLAGMTLTMMPLMQQGYAMDSGVEKVIVRQAGEKQFEALETLEFQIGIFDGLPQESQIQFLMEAVEGVDEVKPFLDSMVAAWLEGDADALAALMNEGMTDPAVAEALLYSRNRNWADWIDTRLDTPGTVFVAVGAGHLAGEKSVQDYLSQRGIQSDRLAQ